MSNQCENNCLNTPGFAIKAGSSALAKITNTTFFKVNGRTMYVAGGDAPALSKATVLGPIANGSAGGLPSIVSNQLAFGGVVGATPGNLAFDDGTVAITTNSCRIYTLCADSAITEAGTVSLYWLAGPDFSKHKQSLESDVAHTPLSTSVELGYLYVKNETSALFVPGTTALDAASVTTVYNNNFGVSGK